MSLPTVLTESVLTIAQAAAYCPAIAGRRVSVKTIYAWADLGVKAGSSRVWLETARLGGRRVTSREAIDRFLAAASGQAPTEPAARSPDARQKSSEKSLEFLRKEFARVGGRKKETGAGACTG